MSESIFPDSLTPRPTSQPATSVTPGQTQNDSHKLVREQAAVTIQKSYRGYRDRRQMRGLGLDPSTRWTEVRLVPSRVYLVAN
jgi:hypothetical protein